jgi:hypothetical protein
MLVSFRLVIVHDLNVFGPRRILGPFEAYAPLAVDPDGILALAIAFRGLQPVGVKRGEVSEGGRGV